jgi:hypothetical protein
VSNSPNTTGFCFPGLKQLELLDSMTKVEQVHRRFEHAEVLNWTVLKHNATLPSDLDKDTCEEQVPISEVVTL